MRIGIATDHGGFSLKEELLSQLRAAGHEVVDFGAHHLSEGDDYPDYVVPLAQAVAAGKVDRGVAICGSGVGASVCANKVHGIRAALIHDHFSARQGVEDDHMNILCMGGRTVGPAVAWDLVQTFLAAEFSQAPRHLRRLGKIASLETQKEQARPTEKNHDGHRDRAGVEFRMGAIHRPTRLCYWDENLWGIGTTQTNSRGNSASSRTRWSRSQKTCSLEISVVARPQRRDLPNHCNRSLVRVAQETKEGRSFPLGATLSAEGANFSVYSKHATGIELLLFDCVDDASAQACDLDRSRNQPDISLLAHLRTGCESRADLCLSS